MQSTWAQSTAIDAIDWDLLEPRPLNFMTIVRHSSRYSSEVGISWIRSGTSKSSGGLKNIHLCIEKTTFPSPDKVQADRPTKPHSG